MNCVGCPSREGLTEDKKVANSGSGSDFCWLNPFAVRAAMPCVTWKDKKEDAAAEHITEAGDNHCLVGGKLVAVRSKEHSV